LTKKVLLTGFEPYGGFEINPSEKVIEVLNGRTIGDAKIFSIKLPVSFKRAFSIMLYEIQKIGTPDIIISTGLMPFASAIQVERVAINLKDYDGLPDNEGETPQDEPISTKGPAAYFATLPVRRIVESLMKAGIPAMLSNSAGTHLCNFIMYNVLHYISEQDWNTRAGFIHFPLLPQQVQKLIHRPVNTPSLPLDIMVRAIEIAILSTIETL